MKKKEIIITITIFVIALAAYFGINYFMREKRTIQVQNQYGDVIHSYPLNKDGKYEIVGLNGYFYLEVKDGKYRAIDVDCPDKVCEAYGWVSPDSYMPIICLPNGIVVVLSDE